MTDNTERLKQNEFRFALLGCGHIGKRHAQHMQRHGILQAVCDIDFNKAKHFAELYNATAYESLDEMLQVERTLDLVAVCTPNGLHATHTIQSLQAGLHVLCEKPMALSSQDCGEMIKQAERSNRRLFIVKQNRFNPPVMEVKRIIDEGRLGEIYSVQLNCFWNRDFEYYTNSYWKGRRDLDGGILYTQFSHFIDLLYWMIGDVKEAYAFRNNFAHQKVIEFEDSGAAALVFCNGVLGTVNFTINAYETNMEGSLTIFGEKGTIKIGGEYLNKIDYQKIEGYDIQNIPLGNPANDYGKYKGSMSNHDKVYENVMSVLLKNGSISTSGYEGLKTVEIIEKIYRDAIR